MSTLELHYFLNDNSHQMNAFTRNACEAELLKILNEIQSIIGLEIKIETLAYQEGGLKEIWKFVSKNKYLMGVISGIILNFLTVQINKDRELDNLQKDKLRLEIQEKRLQIKKLEGAADQTLSENDRKELSSLFVNVFLDSHKLLLFRSHFYKYLSNYDKVTQIDTTLTPDNPNLPKQKTSVQRNDFQKFIVTTNEIEPELIENAKIEIISPVLKKGKYKWRGIFEGEIIDFSIKDQIFKGAIYRQEVSFTSGITIEAVMKRYRKINELDEIIIYKHDVLTVLNYNYEGKNYETKQGKEYLRIKVCDQMQTNLFDQTSTD